MGNRRVCVCVGGGGAVMAVMVGQANQGISDDEGYFPQQQFNSFLVSFDVFFQARGMRLPAHPTRCGGGAARSGPLGVDEAASCVHVPIARALPADTPTDCHS